jgi:hypothetical protein
MSDDYACSQKRNKCKDKKKNKKKHPYKIGGIQRSLSFPPK